MLAVAGTPRDVRERTAQVHDAGPMEWSTSSRDPTREPVWTV